MFQGSIPQQMRGYIAECVARWGVDEVWNGCSGNFTIARSLPGLRHHGNDVTIYSSVLGWWAAGQDVPLTVKDGYQDEIGWLEPYLATPAGRVATMMLATRFFDSLGKDNPYHQRNVAAYRRQWPDLHARTLDKVERSGLRLASYAAEDVLDWVDRVPKDGAFVSFPPFWGAGYDVMWRAIDDRFDWPEPSYVMMGEPEKRLLVEKMTDRRHWFLGLQERLPDLAPHLRGRMQTSAHGKTIYLYASDGPTRVATPRQQITPVVIPRVEHGTVLTGDERVSLVTLAGPQFSWLRSQYLNTGIAPAAPAYAWGVLLDGRLVGCLAFKAPEAIFGAHGIYMLSDFPVAPSRYRRLAALIGMVAQSSEVKRLLERATNRRIYDLTTTAFTNNQVSMKYRTAGLRLVKRRPADDDTHAYQIQYAAPTGRWSAQDAYGAWFRKHAKHQEKP